MHGPLGRQRDDHLTAHLAHTIASANRTKKSKRFKPADFLPKWEAKGDQDPREQLQIVDALISRFKAKGR